MKRKSNILSLILIVLLGLTLVGCKKKTKSTVTTKRTESTSQTTKGTSSSDTTKKPSSSETQTVKPTETTKTPAVKLGTPVITLERSIITIIGSEGATKFKVVVEEQVIEANLEARAYTLSNITNPGTYHVYVIALGDGVNTLDSDKSNTIEYVVKEPSIETIQLRTPQIVLNETSVTWTEVAHATKYEVYVNNEVKDSNVTTTSYSLSSITEDGIYKIKVKAIGDGHIYTDSNFSNEVTYVKSSSETPIKLNAPVIVLDNVNQKITWEAVTGADSYQVYFNGTVNGLPITATEVVILPILPVGEYKVTVKALGDEVNTLDSDLSNEVTFVIEDDVTYDSLEVTGELEKTKYYIGVDTEIDLTGLTFKAVYSDGEKLELDIYQDLTISPVDLTTAGTKTVTISYTEMGDTHSVEITITVEQMKEVSGISIVVAPTAKIEYEEGEDDYLNLAGITITVTYTTGTQETNIRVKEAMIDESTYDLDTAGKYQVKVTYAGKSNTFDITVKAPAPVVVGLRIDGTLAKSTFKVNHVLTLDDLSGITLIAIYSDDSEVPVTITLSMLDYDFSELGDAEITIYYQDEAEVLFVTVENYVTGIQVASKNEDKYSYERNSTNADFLATNTISKVMAVGDPVQLTASELAAVEFTTITPGHREITFTFGDFTVKHTYDITYILRVDYDWQVVQTYLDGYYELGNNITVSSWTSEVGLAPMYVVDAGGYYDYYFDGEGNGTEQGQIGRAFTGKFDGKGYTISDIKVVHDGETVESYGLAIFGWIGEGGIVENFKVNNATIKGWQRLSFLVGRLDGTIQNVIIDYQSEIVHNSENGVSFTPQYGVIGLIGGTGVAKNIDCFAPTGKNGTNDVPLSFLIVETDSAEKCYVGEKYPERIDGINNSVKVEQNKDITLSAVYMNVTYKDGSYGTMNPTSVSEYDKGLLGNQFVTFYIELPQAIGGRVSYQTIIEVVEVQKVLNATLKSEDTIALIPFNTDNWKYDETDWSKYINLTADGEPIDISLVNILVANNQEDQNVKLVITGTGLTEFRIDVPIKYVIDCKEAIFRLNYHPRGNYVITQNIDCENTEKENFTGGNNAFRFYGILDGQNHDIYNINISGSGNGIGLINTNHGTVKNLRLYGSVESDSEAGIITPSNYGTIENIYFEGTLNVFRGGIVSYNFKTSSQEGIIRNVVLNVKVVNGNGIAYTNGGTVQNVLVVYDEASTEFELIHNRNKEAVNVNKVDRRLLDINTYSVGSELWSLVKDSNRVIVGGFALCAIEDGTTESEINQYNIADNDLLSMTWIKGDSIGENAYIQVDLGTLRNANTLFVSMDSEAYLQQYKLYYAESPQSWILIDEFFSNEVIATINSKVRYIKIERTDDRPSNDTLIKILEIGIDKAENPVSISYKNIEKYVEGEETHVYGHTDLSNIIDKDPVTYCWFKAPEIGASIILDMGSIKELTSFEIDMATENEVLNQSKSDNFFRESKVSISLNGVEWIEIGTYTSKVIYHAFNHFVVARYIKLEYLLNEPNGAEVIIREFAFNLDVLLPSGNIDLNNTIDGELTSVLYTTDGMESTALSYEFEGNRPEQRFFIIDLHEVKEINTINFLSVAPWGDRPYDGITYQFSTDNLNYTGESAIVTEISAGVYKIELDTPVEARFIRIIVRDNSKIAISEVSATLSE